MYEYDIILFFCKIISHNFIRKEKRNSSNEALFHQRLMGLNNIFPSSSKRETSLMKKKKNRLIQFVSFSPSKAPEKHPEMRLCFLKKTFSEK